MQTRALCSSTMVTSVTHSEFLSQALHPFFFLGGGGDGGEGAGVQGSCPLPPPKRRQRHQTNPIWGGPHTMHLLSLPEMLRVLDTEAFVSASCKQQCKSGNSSYARVVASCLRALLCERVFCLSCSRWVSLHDHRHVEIHALHQLCSMRCISPLTQVAGLWCR